jgi:hypothetical protein
MHVPSVSSIAVAGFVVLGHSVLPHPTPALECSRRRHLHFFKFECVSASLGGLFISVFFSSACIAEFECGVCGYMAFLDAVMSAGSHSAFAFVLCNVLAKAQRCSTACCEHSGVALCSQRPRHFWPLLSHGQDLCKRLVEDDTEKKTKLLSCCVMVWQKHSGVALLVASTAV